MSNNIVYLLRQTLKAAFGLFLFAFGVYLTICANIGLAPWDCLSMGLSYHTPFGYGIVHTAISIIILVIDVLLKEKIGFGTVLDALLVGNFVDFFRWLNFVPISQAIPLGILLILAGLFIMAYGQYVYMSAGQGCGPRDALLIALGKRFSRLPIGVVQTALVGLALLVGWLLGGPVGIGTVISVFGMGTAMQIVFHLLHFEPRNITHQNLIEAVQTLHQNTPENTSL